ncbi:MAG: hypothetical protein JW982_09885 [Spirochaetes bacterium]|nr:hypothetical protein [Spirochaetota bacterium]
MKLKQSAIFFLITFVLSGQSCIVVPATRIDTEEIIILNRKEIKLENFTFINCSPDGKYISGYSKKNDALIIYDPYIGKTVYESPYAKGSIDHNNVQWSPDSRYLAFTEDWNRRARDSDIWLLDSSTWTIKNLTDDNYQGGWFNEIEHYIDFSPTWTQNSDSIIFIRSTMQRDAAFYQISVKGGIPEKLFQPVPNNLPIWLSAWLNSKTGRLYYTIDLVKRSEPENGIWSYDLSSKQVFHHLYSNEQSSIPYLIDYSDKTDTGLIAYLYELNQYTIDFKSNYFYIWESKSDKIHPVAFSTFSENKYRISNAILSPDGKKIMAVVKTPDLINYVIIKDLFNDYEKIIFKSVDRSPGQVNGTVNNGLSWSNQNTIFISGDLSGSSCILIEITDKR